MEITNECNQNGRASRTINVGGLTDQSDGEILDFALTYARETRSSLFGTQVEHFDGGVAVVTLWRD